MKDFLLDANVNGVYSIHTQCKFRNLTSKVNQEETVDWHFIHQELKSGDECTVYERWLKS